MWDIESLVDGIAELNFLKVSLPADQILLEMPLSAMLPNIEQLLIDVHTAHQALKPKLGTLPHEVQPGPLGPPKNGDFYSSGCI